jgi:hypothetical protein
MKLDASGHGTPGALSDRDLLLNFESLGDNCEFGLVQRRVGAEPLGLLRFSGARLPVLVRVLEARFEGLADPEHVQIGQYRGEYMIRLSKYNLNYHTQVLVNEADPETVRKQQIRILPFLVDKILNDLRTPEKILVFRQDEPMLANDLLDLRAALATIGPGTLLWVQPARDGHPAGSAEFIADRFIAGYVRRLATPENAPDLDLESWLQLLRRVYALWRGASEDAPSFAEIVFGRDGNAGAFMGAGWATPEDGFTWTIGERSLLHIPPLREAPSYHLRIDASPYIAPPALPAQRLEIVVNDEPIAIFDPLKHGYSTASISGPLINRPGSVTIAFSHPRAARPCDRDLGGDDRALAIAFRRLRLEPTAPAFSSQVIEVVFGAKGNAEAFTEDGWSPPEDGFTWAIGERSTLRLPRPREAPFYRLEMDVVPFTVTPALPAQRLEVVLNGESAATFDPLMSGLITHIVPGMFINGRDHMEMILIHPNAARPCDLGAGRDDRPLAMLFHRLTITAIGDLKAA